MHKRNPTVTSALVNGRMADSKKEIEILERLKRAIKACQSQKSTGRVLLEINFSEGGLSNAHLEHRQQVV